MEIVEKAYAKLNLTLDILGKTNGMHSLDMIVASIDLCDIVTVRPRQDTEISCFMDGVLCDESNSAYRGARIFMDRYKVNGVDISIEKHIPFSGGLGGSSADGVAVIRAMQKINNLQDDVSNSLLLKIGSDAPCMYKNGVKRVRGFGDKIDFINIKIPYKVGIIAGNGVDTAKAYCAFDCLITGQKKYSERLLDAIQNDNNFDIARYLGNDLFFPACRINPDVEKAYIDMLGLGAKGVSMSGSGSAIFGLFDDEVDNKLLSAQFVY